MITIAFTRPERRLADSVKMAEGMGFKVLSAPSLDVTHGSAEDFSDVKDRLTDHEFDIVVFSSPTAVEECETEWGDVSRLVGYAEIIPIGPGTSASLDRAGVDTDGMPSEYSSSGLVGYITGKHGSGKVLIIHSDHGSDILEKGLSDAGMEVSELIAYRLAKAAGDQRTDAIRSEGKAGHIDMIAFTSPMSVESFLDSMGQDADAVIGNSKIAAIGDPTRSKLLSEGIGTDIIPTESTFKCLLETIYRIINEEQRQ